MPPDQLKFILEKRRKNRGLCYSLYSPASVEQLDCINDKFGVVLPDQVEEFYRTFNGLAVEEPALRVLPLEDWEKVGDNILLFAVFDNCIQVGFDSSKLNAAGQWNIVTINTGTIITLSMASFWSNKITAWIDKQRPVWLADAEIYG